MQLGTTYVFSMENISRRFYSNCYSILYSALAKKQHQKWSRDDQEDGIHPIIISKVLLASPYYIGSFHKGLSKK